MLTVELKGGDPAAQRSFAAYIRNCLGAHLLEVRVMEKTDDEPRPVRTGNPNLEILRGGPINVLLTPP